MTLRSHPEPEASGGSWEEPPMPEARASGQEEQPEEWWLRKAGRKAERSYPMLKVRKGGGKEIAIVQGKEQWLCFAGAAMKRYLTPKVRETQVRW